MIAVELLKEKVQSGLFVKKQESTTRDRASLMLTIFVNIVSLSKLRLVNFKRGCI